jgi:hypothetical protein
MKRVTVFFMSFISVCPRLAAPVIAPPALSTPLVTECPKSQALSTRLDIAA